MKILSPVLLGISLLPFMAPAAELAPGVRGLATHTRGPVKIDGDLSEFAEAFSTPVEYFNADLKNRAGQFFYMWDEEAFYAGLRTLDTKPANNADDDHLWEGDAVEWYFDTRRNEQFRGETWGKGAVHCYWTGLKGTNVQGRFCLRPGFLDAIPKIGIEVAAKRTATGMDVEFKLPWKNFDGFAAKAGTVIALDAELCYSDGGPRVYRTFVYGSPLSVQQPASQAKIQLVEGFETSFWKQCAPVMAPLRSDTSWAQGGKPRVTSYLALPPTCGQAVGRIQFRLLDLNFNTISELEGKIESFSPAGSFRRARADWPIDLAAPGSYELVAILLDSNGKELGRVAPRMVSVNMNPGY